MTGESERDAVCGSYEEWFRKNPSLYNELERLKKLYAEHGRLNLFCWCAPKRCHAETVKQYLYGSLV